MSDAARKFVAGVILFLVAGTLVGWLYDRPGLGLIVAALLALLWQVRQLLSFDRALRTGNFDEFRLGEGIWQQIYSRFQHEHDKATRRKQRYRQLLLEVRKATNAMPDAAVVLNSDNEIISCNRAAKHLAGLKRKKDRGQRVDNILRDPGLTRLLRSDDKSLTVELPSPTIDGNWLNCRVVPYGADQKLLLLRDVTERIRLTRMRRDFVANASHELRSPLTVIAGYLDGLADDEDMPAGWEKPVAQMQRQARRMSRLLAELLELSRLESAGKARTDEPVDIGRLLDDARTAFQGHADVASIVINVESSAQLKGAAAEIETVIVNLLSNAVRFTPSDGEITLTWRADADGADLIVSDTGEGIDAQHLPRLTERFFRVDRGRSRDHGGTGLGLAIVKHVLVRYGAELTINSEPGEGSEFRCRFPADQLVAASIASLS